MKQNNTFQNFILFLLFFLPLFAFSQETIKGTVNQTGTNEALSGANVLIKGTCSSDDSDNEVNDPSNCDVVYLASNGVTIKACDDANVGDTGVINGVTYVILKGNHK